MSDKITRWTVGVFGDSSQTGRWLAGQRLGAVAVFGDSTLDLREAAIDGDEIEISAVAIFADVNIIVAPGSRVEAVGCCSVRRQAESTDRGGVAERTAGTGIGGCHNW